LPLGVHGAADHAELRRLEIDPAAVLDFSANTNPFGPSPAVQRALAETAVDRYPDRSAIDLRTVLAGTLRTTADHLLAGNGVSELIWLVALAFVRPRDEVLVLGPAFCEYARAATLLGATVTNWRARETNGFALVPREVETLLEQLRPRLVFLANPANPTGSIVPAATVARWTVCHPQSLFVVDEAYFAFAPGMKSVLPEAPANLLVLRSLTKDHALAGLRLGYAVGAKAVIAVLARVQPPWSVNALAQSAGLAALADNAYLEHTLQQLVEAKREVVRQLVRMDLEPLPSAVHFFLLRVGNGLIWREALLRRGILVRDCASFGLPAFLRIATRRPAENVRLLAALREVKNAG
jgi:histidinol-phosphate aminotransferase